MHSLAELFVHFATSHTADDGTHALRVCKDILQQSENPYPQGCLNWCALRDDYNDHWRNGTLNAFNTTLASSNPRAYNAFEHAASAWFFAVGLLYVVLAAFLLQRSGAVESPESIARRTKHNEKSFGPLANCSVFIERMMMFIIGLGLICMVYRHVEVVIHPNARLFDPSGLWIVQAINIFWSIACALVVWLAVYEKRMHEQTSNMTAETDSSLGTKARAQLTTDAHSMCVSASAFTLTTLGCLGQVVLVWYIRQLVDISQNDKSSAKDQTTALLHDELQHMYFLAEAGVWALSWVGLFFVSLIKLQVNPARLAYPPGSLEKNSRVGQHTERSQASGETESVGLLQASDPRSRKLAAIRGLVMIAAFIRMLAAMAIYTAAWITRKEWDIDYDQPVDRSTWHPEFILTALRGAMQSDFSSAEFVHYWADIMPAFGLVLIALNLSPVWHNQEMHCLGTEWILCQICSGEEKGQSSMQRGHHSPNRSEAGGCGSVVRLMARSLRDRKWCMFVTVWGRQEWFFWLGVFVPLMIGSLAIGFTKNCFANSMIGVVGWHVIWAKLMARPIYVVVGLYWLTASRGFAMDLQRAGLDGVLPVAHLLSGQHRSLSLGWWFLVLCMAHTVFHLIAFFDLEPKPQSFFPSSLTRRESDGTVTPNDQLADLYTYGHYYSSLPGVTGYFLLLLFGFLAALMSTYSCFKDYWGERVGREPERLDEAPAKRKIEDEEDVSDDLPSPWEPFLESSSNGNHNWTGRHGIAPAAIPPEFQPYLHGFNRDMQEGLRQRPAAPIRAPRSEDRREKSRPVGGNRKRQQRGRDKYSEPCCRFHQRRSWHVIIAIIATVLMTYVHGSKHYTGKSPVDFRMFSIVCMAIYVFYDWIPQTTFCMTCLCSMQFPVLNGKPSQIADVSARVKQVSGTRTLRLTLRIPKPAACEPCRWGGACCGFQKCCGFFDLSLVVPRLRAGDYMVMSFLGDFIEKNSGRCWQACLDFGKDNYTCSKGLLGRATHLEGSHAFTIAGIDDWHKDYTEVYFLISVQRDASEDRSFTRRLAAVTISSSQETNLQLAVTGPYYGGSGKVAWSGNAAKMLASSGVGCTASTSLLQEMITIGRKEAQHAVQLHSEPLASGTPSEAYTDKDKARAYKMGLIDFPGETRRPAETNRLIFCYMVDRDPDLHTGTFLSMRESLRSQRKYGIYKRLQSQDSASRDRSESAQVGSGVRRRLLTEPPEDVSPELTHSQRTANEQESLIKAEIESKRLVQGLPFYSSAGVRQPRVLKKYFLQGAGFGELDPTLKKLATNTKTSPPDDGSTAPIDIPEDSESGKHGPEQYSDMARRGAVEGSTRFRGRISQDGGAGGGKRSQRVEDDDSVAASGVRPHEARPELGSRTAAGSSRRTGSRSVSERLGPPEDPVTFTKKRNLFKAELEHPIPAGGVRVVVTKSRQDYFVVGANDNTKEEVGNSMAMQDKLRGLWAGMGIVDKSEREVDEREATSLARSPRARRGQRPVGYLPPLLPTATDGRHPQQQSSTGRRSSGAAAAASPAPESSSAAGGGVGDEEKGGQRDVEMARLSAGDHGGIDRSNSQPEPESSLSGSLDGRVEQEATPVQTSSSSPSRGEQTPSTVDGQQHDQRSRGSIGDLPVLESVEEPCLRARHEIMSMTNQIVLVVHLTSTPRLRSGLLKDGVYDFAPDRMPTEAEVGSKLQLMITELINLLGEMQAYNPDRRGAPAYSWAQARAVVLVQPSRPKAGFFEAEDSGKNTVGHVFHSFGELAEAVCAEAGETRYGLPDSHLQHFDVCVCSNILPEAIEEEAIKFTLGQQKAKVKVVTESFAY